MWIRIPNGADPSGSGSTTLLLILLLSAETVIHGTKTNNKEGIEIKRKKILNAILSTPMVLILVSL
jgi:hypothetical protein